MTFIMAAIGRRRMSGPRPEQYLQAWQKNAEQRSAGLVMRMARQTEFIVRRCFLPYLLLVLAVLNLTQAFIYMAAIGAEYRVDRLPAFSNRVLWKNSIPRPQKQAREDRQKASIA